MSPHEEHEPDPAAELRRLYTRLAPPELADDVEDADPETARVVGWMRATYRELAVPAAEPPRVPARRPRRPRHVMRMLALAAVAAGLLLAGTALLRSLGSERPGVDERVARQPDAPVPEPERRIEVRALPNDQVELRSGPVRLVLLAPTEPETGS